MKKLANKAIVITLSVILSLTTLLGCGKGSLAITKSYLGGADKMGYLVNGTADFSGVKMYIEYSDGQKDEISNSDLTFEGVDKITETVGKKTVTVKYTEKRLNKEVEKSFNVDIYEFKEEAHYYAESFEKPTSMTEREKAVNGSGFESEKDGKLAVKQEKYYVGDDNEFVFLPKLTVEEGDDDVVLDRFLSKIEIKNNGNKLVATAVQDKKYVSTYSYDNVDYVTVDYFNQKYDFTDDAIGKDFKLSILPESNYEFDHTINAVELTVSVVDGFNVYNAKEMSIMDNRAITNDDSDLRDHHEWDSIKTEIGVNDKTTNALVFQNDITITKEDIPSEFVWKTEKEYHYEENGQTVQDENGGYFLYDWTELFVKVLGDDETFSIYGNSYNLDVHKIPTVCSLPEENEKNKYYKENYSNANLFDFRMNTENSGAKAFIYDLNCIGNASRREIKSYGPTNQGELVNAGGFIFCKSNRVEISLDNIREQEFFIGFFPSSDNDQIATVMNITNCKAFDNFQNAVFSWGNAEINIKKSRLMRTGGPVMIVQHLCDGSDYPTNSTLFGTVTVDKTSVVESYVSGNEAWFVRMGATQTVAQLKAIDQLFNNESINKTILNSEGKINVACLIMSNGNDTASTSGAYWVNGSVTFEGETEDKTVTLNRQDMLANLMTDTDYQSRYSAGAPMLKSNYAWLTTDETNPYVKALDGNGFTMVNPADSTTLNLYGSFKLVERYLPLNIGGFGIVLGYSNAQ